MNYTEKYHLPQWEESDRIMRTDFNQMCANMEAGLKQAADDAAQANTSTKTIANSALATAQAAYSPSYKPYVIGTYTGNDETLEINLGFQPKFVIVAGVYGSSQYGIIGFAMAGTVKSIGLEVTAAGFKVQWTYTLSNGVKVASIPYTNVAGRQYNYIAFR